MMSVDTFSKVRLPQMRSKRWAVFLSGHGSTAQAAFDCLPLQDLRLVVSSVENSFGLVRARKNGVPAFVLDKKINWQALDDELESYSIQRIFLLGFMKILPAEFCRKWEGRILNIHPSLLPNFKGLHAAEKSYEASADMGVSIHEVNERMDEGRLYLQQTVFRSDQYSNQQKSESKQESKSKISFAETSVMMSSVEQCLIRNILTGNDFLSLAWQRNGAVCTDNMSGGVE